MPRYDAAIRAQAQRIVGKGLDSKTRVLGWLRPEWVALLLGLLGFLAWSGGHAFSPTRIGWVMSGFDTPQHYLGWEFFRNTPWWQWPMGNNPALGSDASGTIVLTDSIPILAFLFKLMRGALPPDFQYFGIWLLCCFELQAWFAYKLIGRLTSDQLLRLLGCGMFLAAPIFLMRLYLHPALAGQWILLAALYLSLDSRIRGRAWGTLLVVASLVHAYLLVMAGAIWLATMFGKACCRNERPSLIVRHVCLLLTIVVLTMWAAGYFVPSAVVWVQSVSHTNLLTFALTGMCGLAEWSRFIPCLPLDPEVGLRTGDGFGYFGLGFLLLVPVAIVLRLWRGRFASSPLTPPRWWPLFLAGLLLQVFAIGNYVYVGNYLVLSFELPGPLAHLWGVFRGAARMEWVLWYLVLLAAIGAVLSRLGMKTARAVLAVVLVVQCLDLSGAAFQLHRGMIKRSHFQNELTAPAWSELASRFHHLDFLLAPKASPYLVTWDPNYRQLAHYAALHGLSINVAYLARLDEGKLAAARIQREALLAKGGAEPSTFYMIADASLWSQILCAPDHGQWHGRIDGQQVVIPEPHEITGLPMADTCTAPHAGT
ncbi:MAG TPA: DUF6311 domain-containing protein [Rhodanobacter sp.]